MQNIGTEVCVTENLGTKQLFRVLRVSIITTKRFNAVKSYQWSVEMHSREFGAYTYVISTGAKHEAINALKPTVLTP